MLQKTRGIVFRFVRFGETSIIVTIFTEYLGIQSYIVNGAMSRSGKGKIALYQPLTLLDLVVYHKENANILRIKECSCIHPYRTITSDVRKSTIGLFLLEMINKTVKEQSHPEEIFNFLFDSFITLDVQEDQFENFHLLFLLKLSKYLGFGPATTDEILINRILNLEDEKILQQLLRLDYIVPIKISRPQRKELLETIIHYYRQHIDNLGDIKSIPVLREILQ